MHFRPVLSPVRQYNLGVLFMFSVAIDGPAGAGKSSIAKTAARELGFIYVDTGALYRTVGYAAMKSSIDIKNQQMLDNLLKSIKIDLEFRDGTQIILLNGEDVSDKIRTPQASMMASNVSAIPEVRAYLFDLQVNMAERYNVIMDGRDIGTVVLPNAQVKIFLTASHEVRADRRYKELTEKGENVEFKEVLDDIVKRDYQDTHRAIAPLKPAEDSVYIDTSELTFDESVSKIISVIKEKL